MATLPTDAPSLARSLLIVPEFVATQRLVPSKHRRCGDPAVAKLPSTAASLARIFVTTLVAVLAIQTLAPSKHEPLLPVPTSEIVARIVRSAARTLTTDWLPTTSHMLSPS